MSGIGHYPQPYRDIDYRVCPVCGKPVKNFEAHVKGREDHKEFEELHRKIFYELYEEEKKKYPKLAHDRGFLSAINQKAWDLAIQQIGGKVEVVRLKEKRPPHALREGMICPLTGKVADLSYCRAHCLHCAAVGHPVYPKYYVCLALKDVK